MLSLTQLVTTSKAQWHTGVNHINILLPQPWTLEQEIKDLKQELADLEKKLTTLKLTKKNVELHLPLL